MGKGIPVNLPSKSFSTKKEAKYFFKEMLHRYEDEEEVEGDDDTLLFELLMRHSVATKKIGEGVKKFYKQRSQDYHTPCFHIKRIDDTTTDFSLSDCINNKKPTLLQKFYKACYNSVFKIIRLKKDELFKANRVYCCETGEEVSKENSEYRHTKPKFREIVREYIKRNNIEINDNMFIDRPDIQYGVKFSNRQTKDGFIDFHKEVAILDIFKK